MPGPEARARALGPAGIGLRASWSSTSAKVLPYGIVVFVVCDFEDEFINLDLDRGP
ncbi:MAG: hypothetical protein WB581_09425 [Halobacteriota archaeon]